MATREATMQTFTLTDNSGVSGAEPRRSVGVKVTDCGHSDFVWIEVDGYGHPEDPRQIALELWNGRLRLLAWDRGGDSDPTVIDLEGLRAVNLGATVGRSEGWDVFDTGGGRMAVQADDDHDPRLDDSEAIRMAREAGVQCDDDGNLTGKATDAD